MDSEKIENSIIEKILSSNEVSLDNISDKELMVSIKEKVVEANYLKEEWQIHYAIERILRGIKLHHKSNSQKSDKKRQTFNFLINFAISILFYSIIKILFKEAFPSLIIGALPSIIFLGIIYFLITKARNSLRGKEILYNILVALIIFPFLAVNIGKFIKTDSAWLILPIAILAYVLAKPVRLILKRILIYITNFFKNRQRKTPK